MKRVTKFTANEFYHIYNRGVGKQEIFLDKEDHERFKKLLYMCNGGKNFTFRENIFGQDIDSYEFERGENLVDICAYVLMPNHFHLYIHVSRHPVSGKEIDAVKFMRKITMAYSKYFNAKYLRTGTLFEGRYKSKHVTDENYFRYLFSYIHLNPVKLVQNNWREIGIQDVKKVMEHLNTYRYSSFIDYFINFKRPERKILDKNVFLSRLDADENVQTNMLSWINFDPHKN